MGNHGVIVIGPSVAQAFDELYYLEKAAELQVLALSTGRPLSLIPDQVAAMTCAQWHAYPTRFSELHLSELMAILDEEEPNYKI
jgi:ribulose-5-phosphate 4-epimerase/fuculose-1-phosphate aldolase